MTAHILETSGLGLDIGGATIVADVGLEVHRESCLASSARTGPARRRYSTSSPASARPTAGRIVLDGEDITAEPPYRRTQLGLGRTFQISSVFPFLTVLENVRLAAEASIGGALRIWRRAGGVREALERAAWALERVGLAAMSPRLASSLAHGDKRKLELAMLLAADKRVIMLDEPMAGVSTEDVPALVEVIQSVHAEHGKTVLMVEHHIEVVTGLAERIAVMHHGRLLAIDTPENVMRNAEVQAAYVGEPL